MVHTTDEWWLACKETSPSIPSPHLDLAWTYLENNIPSPHLGLAWTGPGLHLDLDLDLDFTWTPEISPDQMSPEIPSPTSLSPPGPTAPESSPSGNQTCTTSGQLAE